MCNSPQLSLCVISEINTVWISGDRWHESTILRGQSEFNCNATIEAQFACWLWVTVHCSFSVGLEAVLLLYQEGKNYGKYLAGLLFVASFHKRKLFIRSAVFKRLQKVTFFFLAFWRWGARGEVFKAVPRAHSIELSHSEHHFCSRNVYRVEDVWMSLCELVAILCWLKTQIFFNPKQDLAKDTVQ